MKPSILILGGASEGYALADVLAADPRWQLINSLAGRTGIPRLPPGETRMGGFGGVVGLVAFLRQRAIHAVIDATHPFADTMGWNAAQACEQAQVPLLRLERPAWQPEPGDQWRLVDDWNQAIDQLEQQQARRVLLALGRQEIAAFAGLDQMWFLLRMVMPPQPLPPFAAAEVLLERGPFDLDHERALLAQHAIDTIVCRNSGGTATSAKLIAAREQKIRVILRRRPSRPLVPTVARLDEAVRWLEQIEH